MKQRVANTFGSNGLLAAPRRAYAVQSTDMSGDDRVTNLARRPQERRLLFKRQNLFSSPLIPYQRSLRR